MPIVGKVLEQDGLQLLIVTKMNNGTSCNYLYLKDDDEDKYTHDDILEHFTIRSYC